jgi:GT2 family glycosyltransferase
MPPPESDEPVEVSVVVPTIGRPRQLAACLESIAGGDRRPAEILVVDQSAGTEVAAVVERFAQAGGRVVPSSQRGVARARNLGLRQAGYDIVLMTDDDCTVDPSWTATARALMEPGAAVILTGRVLAPGDRRNVPAIRDDDAAHDFTGTLEDSVLYSGNMVMSRSAVLDFGAFDESFETAEDNDLCYRWLKAGRRLRYEPRLTVWHHDWRTPEEMMRLYVAYGRGAGRFYAKHLRRGDMRVLRFLARYLYRNLRALTRRGPRGARAEAEAREARGVFRGFPAGLIAGFARSRRALSGGEGAE